MSDFVIMRQNMVKGQILPENITNPLVLDAFLAIPRERFIPRQLRRVAYMDANFSFHKGRFLLRPSILARLIEAVNPKASDKILYIGGGTGYGPALLSQIGAYIIALESETFFTQEAEHLVQELKLSSIEVILDSLTDGWEKEKPYDKILIEGCIDFIPKSIFSQLKEGGWIITFKERKKGGSEVVKFEKQKDVLTEISLFDAFAPRLEPFCKKKQFVF